MTSRCFVFCDVAAVLLNVLQTWVLKVDFWLVILVHQKRPKPKIWIWFWLQRWPELRAIWHDVTQSRTSIILTCLMESICHLSRFFFAHSSPFAPFAWRCVWRRFRMQMFLKANVIAQDPALHRRDAHHGLGSPDAPPGQFTSKSKCLQHAVEYHGLARRSQSPSQSQGLFATSMSSSSWSYPVW